MNFYRHYPDEEHFEEVDKRTFLNALTTKFVDPQLVVDDMLIEDAKGNELRVFNGFAMYWLTGGKNEN